MGSQRVGHNWVTFTFKKITIVSREEKRKYIWKTGYWILKITSESDVVHPYESFVYSPLEIITQYQVWVGSTESSNSVTKEAHTWGSLQQWGEMQNSPNFYYFVPRNHILTSRTKMKWTWVMKEKAPKTRVVRVCVVGEVGIEMDGREKHRYPHFQQSPPFLFWQSGVFSHKHN